MDRSQEIQAFIVDNVSFHSRDIASVTMKNFLVTRTTVLRHIKHLIKKGVLFKTGDTKNVTYILTNSLACKANFKLTNSLDEFEIVNTYFHAKLSQLNKNTLDICEYGLTEIINNAIDHSQGKNLTVTLNHSNEEVTLEVKDDGMGVFKKISTILQASDLREAVLQLNKGKFTTDPSNHSGEGIFFCSRIFDEFQIMANDLIFSRYNPENDWFLEQRELGSGTTIKMSINCTSSKKINDIFKQFADPDSFNFNKTEILVSLSKFGTERYISRSQAKRILRNLEEFQIITLDFKGVNIVGQGFVDEVFRVYQNIHPDIKINYINANEDILFMIKRGLPKK